MAAAAGGDTHILAIPPELRLLIYDYVFAEQLQKVRQSDSVAKIRKTLHPHILHVCRLVRCESVARYAALLDSTVTALRKPLLALVLRYQQDLVQPDPTASTIDQLLERARSLDQMFAHSVAAKERLKVIATLQHLVFVDLQAPPVDPPSFGNLIVH
ncbi:hypothetical protein LTR86_001154 [Recurvomyces mirabilis]|nr:hypothetical protein LTR86_001154 [Recurvomyces mirabilis]